MVEVETDSCGVVHPFISKGGSCPGLAMMAIGLR